MESRAYSSAVHMLGIARSIAGCLQQAGKRNLDVKESAMNVRLLALLIASCGLAGGFTRGFAEALPNQDQNQNQQTVEPMEKTPVFRVNVVSRSTKTVDYRHRGGATRVDLKGTELMPRAEGEARVES